jgi:transketolase
LARLLETVPCVVTVEDHVRAGGLGSLVAETIAERGLPCRLARCAVDPHRLGPVGRTAWLLERQGLDAPSVALRARAALESCARPVAVPQRDDAAPAG